MAIPWATHWQGLLAALRFYARARTCYDVHSPLAAHWIAHCLEDRRHYYTFYDVRRLRQYWLQSPETVQFQQDFGAGSRVGQGMHRTVASLMRYSAVDDATGQILFKTLLWQQPEYVLELGTNLGISALYLRGARQGATFVSIEGQPALVPLAQRTFALAGYAPPTVVQDTFANALPEVLQQLPRIDFAWLDGDHRGQSTLDYVAQILPHSTHNSIIAVADIHWSADMEAAWETLKKRPEVTLSIDLFHCGLLFFRTELREAQHLTLVPARWKPWRMGFWGR